jgi:hypothetical protein
MKAIGVHTCLYQCSASDSMINVTFQAVLRSRKEPKLLAGPGAGAGMEFQLLLLAPGQTKLVY